MGQLVTAAAVLRLEFEELLLLSSLRKGFAVPPPAKQGGDVQGNGDQLLQAKSTEHSLCSSSTTQLDASSKQMEMAAPS